nr:PREDICTED: LOW QUALITY PROTEIN: citrate lyase subunit beta-like protein, mitochondrial [Phalacrocorax carbo]
MGFITSLGASEKMLPIGDAKTCVWGGVGCLDSLTHPRHPSKRDLYQKEALLVEEDEGFLAKSSEVRWAFVKREARLTVVKTLEEFDFGHAEKCVRINSVSSGLAEEDLEVLLQSKTLPSSMMLPKVENVEEIRWFSDKFSHHLKGRTLVEPMNFIPFVETAVGLLNFKAVCEEALRTGSQVGFHLDAVVFGGEDFRASIGATSSKETHDILYARQKIIVTAKAFGLQAVDLVYIDFRDEEGLRRQSREGASMGFTGKQVIHPNQIAVVQEQFSPSPEKIKWAQELISAFEEHQRLGKGAFTFHGSMIDMPLLKQAQNIVTLATAIRKNELVNEALAMGPQ